MVKIALLQIYIYIDLFRLFQSHCISIVTLLLVLHGIALSSVVEKNQQCVWQ